MKKVFAALVFALAVFAAHSQSAEKISEILESGQINNEQSAWIACQYSQDVGESAGYSEALAKAVEKGWISSGAVASNPINLQDLCGLCVKACGLKGGLLYRISKANRYAFKELKAIGVLDSTADPSMTVTGQNALSILNACVKKAGGSK